MAIALTLHGHARVRISLSWCQGLSRLSPKGNWKVAVKEKETRNRLHARLNVASIKLELAVTAMSQGRNAGKSPRSP